MKADLKLGSRESQEEGKIIKTSSRDVVAQPRAGGTDLTPVGDPTPVRELGGLKRLALVVRFEG
jgi:hypothetical protein